MPILIENQFGLESDPNRQPDNFEGGFMNSESWVNQQK